MVSECTWAHIRGQVKTALCILKSLQNNTTNRRWSTRCRCRSLLLAQGTQLLTSRSSKEKTITLHVGRHNKREAQLRVFAVEGVRSAAGRRDMWTEFPSEERDRNSSKGRGGTKWEGRGGQSLARVAGAQGWGGVTSWQADKTPWHIKVPGRTPEQQTGESHNCSYFSRACRGV